MNESYCQQPRKINTSTGESKFIRCSTKNSLICPFCANYYKRDKNIIIHSGAAPDNIKDDDRFYGEYDFYTLTLTAPSFGSVENGIPKSGDYKYLQQILWNANSNQLFHHSIKYLKDASSADFSFCAVREWQKRGTIHFHILFRVDKKTDDGSFLKILRRFRTYKANKMGWGREYIVELVDRGKIPRIVKYFSKSLTEDVRQHGNDYALLDADTTKFYERLDEIANTVRCQKKELCLFDKCNSKTHEQFGWNGQLLTVSREWSFTGLTVQKLKEERKQWVKDNIDTIPEPEFDLEEVFNDKVEKFNKIICNEKLRNSRIHGLFDVVCVSKLENLTLSDII